MNLLPMWGDLITYTCALCPNAITIKYHGRNPTAFCRACAQALRRRHKTWTTNRVHGQSHTPLYGAWANMRARCYQVRNPFYARYGGRGITVCEEWRGSDGFMAFFTWAIANGYALGLQLDRRDNNGSYDPLNCQWVTPTANARNKSTVLFTPLDIARIKRQMQEGKIFKDLVLEYPRLTSRTYRSILYAEHWADILPEIVS